MKTQHGGLVCVLSVLLFASACAGIVAISGPVILQAGDTAVYVLSLAGSGDASDLMFYVAAEVPASWTLDSNSFTGTANGLPISGSGTVVSEPLAFCVNGPRDGFQMVWLEAGPYSVLPTDTAEATLQFSVNTIPEGEFALRFWFVESSGQSCGGNPTTVIVNQGSGRLYQLARTLTAQVDSVLGTNLACVPSVDGDRLVFAGGTADVLSVFDRVPETGNLMHIGSHSDQNSWWYVHAAISPDNLHLYAASSSNLLVALHLDPLTGVLTPVQVLEDDVDGVDGLDGITAVAVSPAGDHVYAVSSGDDAIAVFSRNPSSGELTFVEAEFDTVGGVDGIDGSISVAVSADGANVYVGGSGSRAVAIFDRSPTTGQLTFVEWISADLWYGRGLAVSPDGRHLYVTLRGEDAIAVYSRDPATGVLTQSSEVSDGAGDVFGLWRPSHLSLAPDGGVLAAVGGSGSLVLFERDPDTGDLSFVHADLNLGLGDPLHSSVVFTPDIKQLLLTDGSDSVLVFDGPIFADGFESSDMLEWSTTVQ